MNRPAFQGTPFSIGRKGFRSRGWREKGLLLPNAFVLTHMYAHDSPEECQKRIRAECDAGTFEPNSDCSSPLLTQSRAFSIFNPKVISAMGFSPEVSKELVAENFKNTLNTDPFIMDHSSSSSDMLDFDMLDELQDFDFWCNETTL